MRYIVEERQNGNTDDIDLSNVPIPELEDANIVIGGMPDNVRGGLTGLVMPFLFQPTNFDKLMKFILPG